MVRQRVRTERLAARLAQLRPEAVLAQRAARLHISGERLHAAMWRRIAQREVVQLAHQRIQASVVRRLRLLREHLVASQRQLSAVDPHAVLRRGYSITTMSRGGVVRSVTDVQQGELIATRVSDGSFGSIVSAGGVAVRRVRAAPRAARAGDQFDLFH
jgi:exodeoxyribonuclease VII large subunit